MRVLRFCAALIIGVIMKKLVNIVVMTGLVSMPALALADEAASPLSANIGVTSDYLFRGISQTAHDPALQGGVDYANPNGLYLGVWGSNVSWVKDGGFENNSSLEGDLYGGYKGKAGDFGYDVGAITYYYPGDQIGGMPSPNTTELYLGGSWKFLSAKYSHAVSPNFIGWVNPVTGDNSRGSDYLELNANYDMGSGWGLIGHVGHQSVENYSAADYTDYKLGVSKDVGFGVVSVAYSDTNANSAPYTVAGKNLADGRGILSFTKSF
jgi:uncharacterized protein (TIGR02001 family)